MATKRLGLLPRRYTFMLNPHNLVRLSSCTKCGKLTYPRKFPLLICIEDVAVLALGKTCKYCSRCETIMCQQDELEAELVIAAEQRQTDATGKAYQVVGTVERKAWQAGIKGELTTEELWAHTAEFKKQIGLSVTPGGWYLEGHEPPPLPAFREQRVKWPDGFDQGSHR
jgi:hypothetical protein